MIDHAAEGCGFGRIHVKRVDKEGAGYLAKYLAKQDRPDCLRGKRLWAAFGSWERTRVKDVELESDFTRAVKFCQERLRQKKLPFLFVSVLRQFPTADPVRLKLACAVLKASGPHVGELMRVLRE